MTDFNEAREWMVEAQIVRRGIGSPAVLAAMRSVPREEFVDAGLRDLAYQDTPLPIGNGQTISQPAIVAAMLDAAQLKPTDRVLDVGTGSGYAAAVAAAIAGHVHSIERHAQLVDTARAILARLSITNVTVHLGDGTIGLAAHAPYDAIIAAAAGPRVPQAWREQLAIGGHIVMPLGGDLHFQRLIRVVRRGENDYEQHALGDVRFVPLVGADGWPAQDDGAHQPGRGICRGRLAAIARSLCAGSD